MGAQANTSSFGTILTQIQRERWRAKIQMSNYMKNVKLHVKLNVKCQITCQMLKCNKTIIRVAHSLRLIKQNHYFPYETFPD